MAGVEDILKKLNKNKKEADKHIGILGDRELKRTFISTGSPYIDYLTGGGFVCGAYNCIVASGGTGKSSLALLACKDAVEKGKKAVYYDGEGTMDDSYFSRMGIDKHKLVYETGRNLEDMLDFVEAMSTADDVGVIVIDSIPIFVATAVEAKSAGDNHIGTEAKRYTTRMPIIEGNCMKRGIALIGLTSYKLNPNAMGDPRVLPRGEWQKTMANTLIDMTKKDPIINEEGIPIGHIVDVRVKKTKTNTYNPKKVFKVNFYYEGGFDHYGEYVNLFIENKIVEQGGAWYKFFDNHGVEQSLQGKAKVVDFFVNNLDAFHYLKEQLDDSFNYENLEADIITDEELIDA